MPGRGPQRRPASAQVLAELTAAVWEREARPSLAFTRRRVGIVVLIALVGLVAVVKWSPRVQLAFLAPAVISPEALADRGRELLGDLGYTAPRDSVSGFFVERDSVASSVARDRGAKGPARLRGTDVPVLRYFYRESDRPIVGSFDAWGAEPRLPWRDTERGVELAPGGQLLAFHGAPPRDAANARSAADAWVALQAAASLPSNERRSDRARDVWPIDFPGAPDAEPVVSTRRMQFAAFWNIASLVIALATALVFAHRAWRRGQIDLRATRHVAASFLSVVPATWLLVTHHSVTTEHMQNVVRLLAWTLWTSGAAAVCFAATSVCVRRWWPDAFGASLHWIRRGKVDATLGADLLAGVAFGIALALIDRLYLMVPAALGWAPPSPITVFAYQNLQAEVLGGPGAALGYLLYQAAHLGWLIAVNTWWLCLFKLMLKRTSAAVIAKAALDTYVIAPATNPWMLGATYTAMGFGASLWLFVHRGFVAMFVAAFVRSTLLNYPLSLSVDAWFSPLSWVAFFVVGSSLVVGARLALNRGTLPEA